MLRWPLQVPQALVDPNLVVYQFWQTISSDVVALFVQSLGKVHAVINAAEIHIIASEPLILTYTYIYKQ